jgi:hypothetical protein
MCGEGSIITAARWTKAATSGQCLAPVKPAGLVGAGLSDCLITLIRATRRPRDGLLYASLPGDQFRALESAHQIDTGAPRGDASAGRRPPAIRPLNA